MVDDERWFWEEVMARLYIRVRGESGRQVATLDRPHGSTHRRIMMTGKIQWAGSRGPWQAGTGEFVQSDMQSLGSSNVVQG